MIRKSFIETQFPVDLIGIECHKERAAGAGQTLTGLGKWWGRKPLILVRAILLGILMPASDDPKKDMDIFLKILTMDEEGLWLRHTKSTKKKLSRNDFDKLSYKDKVKLCVRPEHIENLDENDWLVINSHLNTSASSFQELFNELGIRKFGHVTKAGDVFCGAGSIPFELSRLGCDTYASDLNPVATMLTYASLNILSQNNSTITELQSFQDNVYTVVKDKIKSLGLETNEQGHQALSYLYCNETMCPHCGKTVPLSPSWVISNKYKTIAKLIPNGNNFLIEIESNVSKEELKVAKNGTIQNRKFVCPSCSNMFTISSLRGDKKTNDGTIYGLRKWNNEDIVPRDFDVFKERLYCIKYVDNNGKTYYCAPSKEDLMREEHVLKYIQKYFKEWQEEGYIPSDKIIHGEKTDELLRTRGWTHWHHLFNPRQLLLNGLLNKYSFTLARNTNEQIVGLLGVNKCCDFNSKLSAWQSDGGTVRNTFSEKALNTLFNYGVRSSINIKSSFLFSLKNSFFHPNSTIKLSDARQTERVSDIWITDPPYADAVNYHELTEFFLAWDKKAIRKIFPEWYADTKRELAVKGKGQSFNDSMVEVYSNLTNHMSDNGYQVIMFNHSSKGVIDELLETIDRSGLKIVSNYSVVCELTESGLKKDKNHYNDVKIYICKKK